MKRAALPTAFATVALVGLAATLFADTMLVPTIELREEEPGLYVLDARMAPSMVSTAAPPSPPEGCVLDAEPEITEQAQAFVVRYVIDCRERPLRAEDEIHLPWNVDGIQLTVRWAGGEERRGLFGREPIGVVIRLEALMPSQDDPWSLTRQHFGLGLRHFLSSWAHLLLIVTLAALLPLRRLLPVLAGLTAGHALALVLVDAGGLRLPTAPAEATLAAGIVVFAAAFSRQPPAGREPQATPGAGERGSSLAGPVTLGFVVTASIIGVVHGLGLATSLAEGRLVGRALVVSLFAMDVGIGAAGWALGLGITLATDALPCSTRRRRAPALVAGALGAFLMFSVMGAGLSAAGRLGEAESFQELDLAATTAALSNPVGIPRQLDVAGRLARPFFSYLIVEPYQVRLEVLVAVPALDDWLEIPLDESGVITSEDGIELAQTTADLLAARTHVAIDGLARTPTVQSADFVTVGPTGVLTRERPMPEFAATAILGATLLFETEGLADTVLVEWGLVPADGGPVPITTTDPAATLESEFTTGNPILEWRNTLGEYALLSVESVSTGKPSWPFASLVLLVLAGLLLYWSSQLGRLSRSVAVGFLLAAYLLYPFARVEAELPLVSQPRVSQENAADILERLLTNVYRSFDIHSEEAVYDRLALTVTGDQLVEVYLESRQALELENRGGARVRIEEVVVQEVRSVRRGRDGRFDIDLVWSVGGSVNHFGHQHFRQNRYDAVVSILPVDGVWKIEGVEVAEERRLL